MGFARGAAIFVVVLVLGAGVIFALGHLASTETSLPPAPPGAEPLRLPPPPVGSQWRYTSPKTWSASEPGVEACTKSTAEIAIGGGAKAGAELCLRRGGGYPYAASIVLGDMGGHITCAACAVRVTFDNGGGQSFDGAADSTDGTDYTLFMRDGPGLAARLKHASTATFEVSIRGAGDQKATFNVAGLRWA